MLISGRIGSFRIGIDTVGSPLMTPLGYSRIIDLSAAVGLSPPDGAVTALLVAEVASLRFRDDGVDPTSSFGFLLPREAPLLYQGDLAAIRIIEVSPGASLDVLYYAMEPPPSP